MLIIVRRHRTVKRFFMDFATSFSVRLKALRQEHSLTQPALANAIGLSKQTINDLEHARIKPSVLTLLSLADFFDVSIDYLLSRTDNPKITK